VTLSLEIKKNSKDQFFTITKFPTLPLYFVSGVLLTKYNGELGNFVQCTLCRVVGLGGSQHPHHQQGLGRGVSSVRGDWVAGALACYGFLAFNSCIISSPASQSETCFLL